MTVLCYGDSITEGNMLPPADREAVWPTRVDRMSNGKINTLNEGSGGRPSASIGEFQAVLKKYAERQIDVLLLALGMNDSRDVSGQCVPKAVENLRHMIVLARGNRPALRVLLVGPSNIRKDALGPSKDIADQREQNLRDLNTAYEKLAQETGSSFISLFGVVPPAALATDGVHPDAAGNDPIAQTILSALLGMPATP